MLKQTPEKGIYSFDGRIHSGSNFNPVLIVHPFFPFNRTLPGKDGIERLLASLCQGKSDFFPYGANEYRRVLLHLSRNYPGPVVILEEEPRMDSTVDFFFSMHAGKKAGHRYFIRTEYHDDALLETSRKGLHNLIRQFGKKRLLIAGGYLDNDHSRYPEHWELRSGGLDGCLGYCAMKVRDSLGMELKPVKGATFSREQDLCFLGDELP